MYMVGKSISFPCFGVSVNLSFFPAPMLCLYSHFVVPFLPYKCCFDIMVTRCPTTPSINRHLCSRWYKWVGNNLVPWRWIALSGACNGDQTGLMTVAGREMKKNPKTIRIHFQRSKQLFHEPDIPLKISIPKNQELCSVATEVYFRQGPSV